MDERWSIKLNYLHRKFSRRFKAISQDVLGNWLTIKSLFSPILVTNEDDNVSRISTSISFNALYGECAPGIDLAIPQNKINRKSLNISG